MNGGPSTTEFAWYAHPARDHAGRALGGAAIVLAFGAMAAVLMGSPWWGALAVAVMLVALNRFFFVSRYSIDEDGITARFPLRRQRFQWADLRRFAHDEDAGYLSTRRVRSRFGTLHGMHVLLGREPRAVVEQIARRLDSPPGPVHPGADPVPDSVRDSVSDSVPDWGPDEGRDA